MQAGRNEKEKNTPEHFDGMEDICEEIHLHKERVERARLHQIDDEIVFQVSDLFKVLGDPTRIKILALLAREQEMCVCDIAASLAMGQSAISHQLRVLRGARLVKFRKDGKEAFYRLDDDHVLGLIQQAVEHTQE